jgi:hypothetical protein
VLAVAAKKAHSTTLKMRIFMNLSRICILGEVEHNSL